MRGDSGKASGEVGADFVVVANRLPVDLVRDADGTEHWKASPGGLVTALESILMAHHGAWVGWPGVPDASPEPFDDDGIRLHSVTLSARDIELYYEGFSNATLWPLFHDVVVPPEYHREWWYAYRDVNTRFAEATAAAAAHGATVWVQDYQLLLVPRLLRELRPDLTIGFFLHIPFPPVELFMQLPWRTELVEGMLGADLVGFHLPGGADNFRVLASKLRGHPSVRLSSGKTKASEIRVDDRMVRVGAFPISIDSTAVDSLARPARRSPEPRDYATNWAPARADAGCGPAGPHQGHRRTPARTRGTVRGGATPPVRGDAAAAGHAEPRTRRAVPDHAVADRGVGRRINGTFGEIGQPVVTYLHRPVPKTELTAFYAAADVMLVTPVRDGMNLVAKEYVATCTDGAGALVLSEFAGAANELRQAYLCNPHDLEGVKDAIMAAAVDDPPEERRRRMRALRRQVLGNDVHAWARRFFNTLDATSES